MTSSGDFGPATWAGVKKPYGIAFDSSGNLFLAEYGHNIRRVDRTTGIITTVLENGPGRASNPTWLAFDLSGRLLFSDIGYTKILRLDLTTGALDTFAGNGGMDFTGDGVPAASTAISGNPIGIAVDAAGNVYLASSGLFSIRRVDATTGIIATVAGNSFFQIPSPDGQPANNTPIDPQAVAIAPDGSLVFSEVFRVRRVSLPSPWTYTATSPALVPATVLPGQTFNFTATVVPIGGAGIPTGTVTFMEASAHSVIGTADLAGGTATLTTAAPTLPGATYRLLAVYGGDTQFAACTSPAAVLTVQTVKVATSLSLTSITNPSLPDT